MLDRVKSFREVDCSKDCPTLGASDEVGTLSGSVSAENKRLIAAARNSVEESEEQKEK